MLLVLIQGAALVLQMVAAVLALRLIRITRRWAAWAMIAVGITLVVALRCVDFFPIRPAALTPRNAADALLRLAISLLMLVGIALIAPLFSAMRQAQEALEGGRDALEARVRERTAELERSNRDLAEFAYVASHDLQEPLRKILAFGDRLERAAGPDLSPEARDYLERMEKAARRMQNLINALLTYSRITTQARPFVHVDLGRIAREVLSDLEVALEETAAVVRVGKLATSEADPSQMQQLFQNLLGNALKFRRPGVPPEVDITGEMGAERTAAGGGLYRLEFRDNGIGFEDKYRDRIFAVFQRLHARHEYEGSGIGLSICRKLVERHGGSITARSVPGRGTVFVVTLPCRHGQGEK